MKKLLAAILACSMIASVGVSTLVAAADVDSKETLSKALLRDGDGKVIAAADGQILPAETYYFDTADLTFAGAKGKDKDGNVVTGADLTNGDEWKFSGKKGSDNSKLIKKISLVENKDLSRRNAIKIETADIFTGDEYKISPEFTFTGQDALKKGGANWKDNKITYKVTLYVQNVEQEGDQDVEVGTGGIVIKPAKNEDNEITWTQDGDNIARLTFYADSDVAKVFPKLSTKWDNSDYFEYFNNQDAFIFEFVGGSTISSTSRALLELYNPYVDEDGNLTVDLDSIFVYEVKDGELVDVTDSWTKSTNEDGDEVITSKTRVLGTYILAEEEVDIGGDNGDIDEPTGTPDAPSGKPNPPTGR